MEVEIMLQSMAEVTLQRGIEQGIGGNPRKTDSTPETAAIPVSECSRSGDNPDSRHPHRVHLDMLFEKVLTTENLEDID